MKLQETICENITVRDGELFVEAVDAFSLVREYGSPLYVTSEAQLRLNYRKIFESFTREYPKTLVMCAMKANNNMAVRRVLSDEGAGGEAFGPGELWALLKSGANPKKCVLNGAYKEDFELKLAIENGVRINADSYNELVRIAELARELNRVAEVRIRLRLQVPEFELVPAQAGGKTIAERFAKSKFGLSTEQAVECARFIMKNTDALYFTGYSFHLGRQSLDTGHFAMTIREMINAAHEVELQTGAVAKVINIGGGIPSSVRDAEGHGTSGEVPPVEQYAKAMAAALRQGVADGLLKDEPVLEIEPGRSVVGNSTVLLTTIKLVKRNQGRTWAVMDAGGNQLTRIDSSHYFYYALKAHHNPGDLCAEPEPVDVAGYLCSGDTLCADTPIRRPQEGDILAILDAGMYAETTACQFNGRPRPATVMVNGGAVTVIKRRETIEDVFSTQRVSERYAGMNDKGLVPEVDK
ncbi:MAG: hypothetical protein Q4C04_08505 [Clostridia bacterium]|nr:hypothetical protein [Clostridia bacterium]